MPFIPTVDKKTKKQLDVLAASIEGDLYYSNIYRLMYATDASVYRELPSAVVYPKNQSDVKRLIAFAIKENLTLIPRAAGTSLAGQVVGNGIVVDVSKYMTQIIELNVDEKWVKVQPGVILDELNKLLEKNGLFFGPETSTSNRCMIGGMVGNNACGAHSLIYGSTRDHLIAVKTVLSDGSEVVFEPVTDIELQKKISTNNLEGNIYKQLFGILNDKENQRNIKEEYPEPSIRRRNTAYAIDILLEQQPFNEKGGPFNIAKLIAGSEGTLAFITEIKLNLVETPPKHKGLLCAHFSSVNESLKANLIALKHNPASIELIDNVIIDCTKENIEQNKNRFFIQGNPGAILIIEFYDTSQEHICKRAEDLVDDLKKHKMGYHFPLLFGGDIAKVWALRKAGLGLLSNVEGDAKPVAVIEDTAVNVNDLPDYIDDFQKLLEKFNLSCVYYAHAATGQLHLRPVLNLKNPKDVIMFRTILFETAKLVKKYRGALSGEHGDGRLRGEFIPFMIGQKNYLLINDIKNTWDPHGIFNNKKIIDTPPMNTHLRFNSEKQSLPIETLFDFSKSNGILGAVEKCNGSADCRKTISAGGLMCPSYMATLNEVDSTRARANILREFLTHSDNNNPFNHKEIFEVMDLCLSCKGCKSECPSNIDMTKLKAEFLHHYYKNKPASLRTMLIANISYIYAIGSYMPSVFNFFISNTYFSYVLKKLLGFAPLRSIPSLSKTTLSKWANKNLKKPRNDVHQRQKVLLFNDEFTMYNDTEVGIKALKLLVALGYDIELTPKGLSGRTYLSKGILNKAKNIANNNLKMLKDKLHNDTVLVGIEPSAILSFRDEYLDLASIENKAIAVEISKKTYLFDEFIFEEMNKGNISKELFTKDVCKIFLHGHCHQKAIASIEPTRKILEFPENFSVEVIKSSCCGMAGSFGYEKEHYETSLKIAELHLLPELRKVKQSELICAPGTSCRHQIKDGTGLTAMHPAEILFDALIID